MAGNKRKLAGTDTSLTLYRRLAVAFVFVVAAILIIVLYVSTVSATISVTPVKETLKTEFVLDVVETPTKDSEIRGRVVSATIGRSKLFQPSGEGKKLIQGKAHGKVTIINDGSTAQPLVTSTRLWTEDQTQFRIQESVIVPAHGSVEVEAVADEEGATGDIGPSRLTIPGLTPTQQTIVYAKNDQAFTGGSSLIAVVSQDDIDRGVSTLKAELEEEARKVLQDEAGTVFDGSAFYTNISDSTPSVQAGEEASQFDVSVTIQVVGVFYDNDALHRLALAQLYNTLGQGREFVSVNEEGIQSFVERYDLEGKRANVRVYLDGVAVASTTSEALEPGRFVGMNAEDVEKKLISEGVATQVETTFFPFFVKHVPHLRDHIYVHIR